MFAEFFFFLVETCGILRKHADICGNIQNFEKKTTMNFYRILRKNVELENAMILQRNNYPIGSRAELDIPHTPSNPGGNPQLFHIPNCQDRTI